ncbi:hypothetical protein [Ruminococcus flavefaciens]|uniref:Uncharacterized protein n=1 Tax=Ruminococcus flavefaciens TaxID=1265 RepID=A0A1K1MGT7_RUMFL|nr:hypothetical protein [Ruminococcus flavefaciens]SFW22297.1 hypothetical protein SAMN02910280_1191 [Ruminococcus flavefaciens]
MDSEIDYIDIRLVTGERVLKPRNYVVGFCHFPGHKGGITRKILQEHDCLNKNCSFLEKYTDNQYWDELKRIQLKKSRRKNKIQTIKAEKAAIKRQFDAITSIYYEIALCIIEELGYDIKILDIKKVPQMRKYALIYISSNPYNDWYRYMELVHAFVSKTGLYLELKHAKNIDGSYATF